MLARTETRSAPAWGPGRLRLALFLAAAAWIHLGFFLLWERLGPDLMSPPPVTEEMLGTPLEITLELSSPEAGETAGPDPPAPDALSPAAPPAGAPGAGMRIPPPETPESPPDAVQAPPGIPDRGAMARAGIDFPLSRDTPLLQEGAPGAGEGAGPAPDSPIRLERTAPAVKSYDASVRAKVNMHWILPPEARANFQPGRFTASMTLAPDGTILIIMVEESSGSTTLDHAAMEALKAAAPYDPFPETMAGLEQMTFRIHFDYRAVVRRALPGQMR